jgi:hypothetical protein
MSSLGTTESTPNKSISRKKELHELGLACAGAAWLLLFVVASSGWGAPTVAADSEASSPESDTGRVLFLRPHAGVGWASSYNRAGDALALHAGGRLLFPAPLAPNIDASFGLEATYLQLDITGNDVFSERYAAVGIVLEMTVLGGFNLGIGTLGYVGVGGTDRNPFGVVTNLGWEPSWDSRVRPYVTMRSEWIFDAATYSVLSLSAGINFGI